MTRIGKFVEQETVNELPASRFSFASLTSDATKDDNSAMSVIAPRATPLAQTGTTPGGLSIVPVMSALHHQVENLPRHLLRRLKAAREKAVAPLAEKSRE